MSGWRSIAVLLVGGMLGAAIWAFSPAITGKAEPWDAQTPYYNISLFVAGFLAAFVYPRHFWLAPIGIYVGQFTYAFLFLPGGPLWAVGLVFGALYCLLALAGAALAMGAVKIVAAVASRKATGQRLQ